MCPNGVIAVAGDEDDKLSNLTTALVFIERGEGDTGNHSKLEDARKSLVDAIKGFKRSRFTLGCALAEYKTLYKQEMLWSRAEKEIAAVLGCNPRTISRIIEESEAATGLHPFVLEAMEQHRIDPGKKKNAPVVEDLLRRPIAVSRQEADADVRSAIATYSCARKGKAKRSSDSLEGFAYRIVKLFEDRFTALPPEKQLCEIQFCISKVLAALHIDLQTLCSSQDRNQEPISKNTHDTAAA